MTNNLEERLKAATDDAKEAEAYVKELEAELREARIQSLSDMGQAQEAYEAQLEAEDKLATAMEALEEAHEAVGECRDINAFLILRTALTELKGENQ